MLGRALRNSSFLLISPALILLSVGSLLALEPAASDAPTTQQVSVSSDSVPSHQPTAIERAEGLTLQKAVGHWARARKYMLLAIRELDSGLEDVDPSSVIDADELRSRMLDHIQVLDRVLDPQPRVTEGGVTFQAAPEFLGAEKR
ncbi:MAG: hypothetical protein KDD70_02475 [Bdellovibrionales bacterium]|nr:hypothetical protein [Bdellovibrionales bacterium]